MTTDWWSNASSLATGGGTLVLALATFASVRSANRSARVAETALREQRRPVLVHSRLEDAVQKIMFIDERCPGLHRTTVEHVPEDELRGQTRDLYVPAGDIGVWQGALRDPEAPGFEEMAAAVDRRQPFSIELMYSDNVGDQRTISRFTVTPMAQDGDWMVAAGRHWYLDGIAPR